uniref:Uncharacterized protein n=1 Tax=Arundo donax TaxID=35708 RepID=A0A0A9HBZ7_ARUDO
MLTIMRSMYTDQACGRKMLADGTS